MPVSVALSEDKTASMERSQGSCWEVEIAVIAEEFISGVID